MAQPKRFNEPRFYYSYARGARFVWPAEARMAYTTTSCESMYRFTPEFMLRVTNLRPWTLTKDFLDANPDLRGLAPQFEPSATNVRVSSRVDLERLYWQMLRRRYESFLKERK